jgi:flagellar protein FliT
MDVNQTLFSVTTQLAELTSNVPCHEKRDEVIEKIFAFLDERDALLPIVELPKDENERDLMNKIVELNIQINRSMNSILADIKKDLTGLKKKKKAHNQYINPYKSLNNVSAFFDKKE